MSERTSTVPAGHGITAHTLFGWCSACPGRTVLDELTEWRSWAYMKVDVHWPTAPPSTMSERAERSISSLS